MKKFFIYFFAFILICFFLPALFTKKNTKVSNTNVENDVKQNEIQNETQNQEIGESYGKIKLLHKKTGEIEEVDMEEYLYNVVSAEMPADFEVEALKAQAMVARTYTMYKIKENKHKDADICDDSTCCQAWVSKEDRLAKWEESKKEENWEKIKNGVDNTKGLIITYNNEPICAFFHANSGGITELPVNVWGGKESFPYLEVVQTSGENNYSQYESEIELSNDELINKLKEKYSDIQIDFNNSNDVKILEYTESDRVKTVKFGNHEIAGVEVRSVIGLKSTNFDIIKEEGKIKFVVKGYGHGVGMSQTGANTMAKEGSNYKDIINHFYKNIEIKNVN